MAPKDERCINLVKQLNNDIQEFTQKSAETSFNIKWEPPSYGFEPIRCWEIKSCRDEKCPSYGDNDNRCWLTVGTLCGGEVQGKFAQKIQTCYECKVFKKISEDHLRLLYENVNILMYHLEDKFIEIQERAIKDPLTRLYNRHFFDEVMVKEAARTDRNGNPFSLLMMDIDNFKQVNDGLGHFTGDKILIEVGFLFRKTLRETDYLFRFGGDEFLVILQNTGCDKLINVVRRLLTAVDDWNKDYEDTYGYKLSFSLGCSTYEKGCDYLKILKEADEKMYRNKMSKRNGYE
ncbi:MAG: GGDEF domain-containing protein [Chloroflexi bacterium]|nr:GGDEF domain-containing protein [Chloroflexota bacterium]